MERGSDKHAPRIDEELDQATQGLQKGEPSESRAQEFRQIEGLPEPEDDEADAEPGEPEAGPEAGGPEPA